MHVPSAPFDDWCMDNEYFADHCPVSRDDYAGCCLCTRTYYYGCDCCADILDEAGGVMGDCEHLRPEGQDPLC